MPIMDGITATEIINKKIKLKELPNTPVIALTAQPMKVEERSYFFDKVGFINYLTKPIAQAEFLKEIKKYVNM